MFRDSQKYYDYVFLVIIIEEGSKMDREYVKKSVVEILSNQSEMVRGVILLKGRWGCGKTYFWNHEIKKALEKELVGKGIPVAYSSCFGVESLNKLKSNIISSVLTQKDAWDNLSKIGGRFAAFGKKVLNVAQQRAGVELLDFKIDPLDLYSDEFVICIDDIERKSDSIGMKDLLGLISILSEKKNARVVLIANEESLLDEEKGTLNETDKKDYASFVEKVVSYRFHLDAKIDDFYSICVKSSSEENEYLENNRDVILGFLKKAEVNNLRSVVQIIQNIHLIRSNGIELAHSYLKLLMFYTVCSTEGKLSKGEDFFNFHVASFGKGLDPKNISPEENEKKNLVERFYDHCWEYNHNSLLFNFVYSGCFNREELKKEIDPEPEKLNSFQKYLRSFNDIHLFFQKDAYIQQKIYEGESLIKNGDVSLTAAQLVSVISHLKICYKFLSQTISQETNDRVKELIKELAKQGDETFQDRFHMSHYSEYFKDYVEIYKDNLQEGLITNKSSQIREMIRKNQRTELLEYIDRRADNLRAFCEQILGDEIVKLYFEDREWGYDLIVKSASRLNYFNKSKELRNNFEDKVYKTLEMILNSSDCEKSDQFRVKEIINEALVGSFSKSLDELGTEFIKIKSLNN